MGRKKLIVCNLNFDDNETIEEKVSKMFAPENLISCFSEKNYQVYKKAIQHANIQMVLNDEELMNTINAFFASGLNTSLTSENTFMHRNTLNYRIDKVKKLTGLNLKNFDHAVVFKNLMIINDMIKSFEQGEEPTASPTTTLDNQVHGR